MKFIFLLACICMFFATAAKAAPPTGVIFLKNSTQAIYQEANMKSPTVATVSKPAEDQPTQIKDTSGNVLHAPELRYEDLGFPILESKSGWHKVGLSREIQEGFPTSMTVVGWIPSSAGEYQTLGTLFKNSMTEIAIWDRTLFKGPGSKEKIKVSFPSLKILGTARLKSNAFKKTGPCEIPFFTDDKGTKLIGICPQNFSFLHGSECANPQNAGTPEAIFCLQVYVLEETARYYKVAFKSDLVRFRKDRLQPGTPFEDSEYAFRYGWVEKSHFDKITPMTAVEHESAQNSVIGRELKSIRGVEVLEVKTVGPDEWLRVKVIEHCSEEKSYGEGWLPVHTGDKVTFSVIARGC